MTRISLAEACKLLNDCAAVLINAYYLADIYLNEIDMATVNPEAEFLSLTYNKCMHASEFEYHFPDIVGVQAFKVKDNLEVNVDGSVMYLLNTSQELEGLTLLFSQDIEDKVKKLTCLTNSRRLEL